MRFLPVFLVLFASASAFAGCEDGNLIAELAVLDQINATAPALKDRCTAISGYPKYDGGYEVYGVSVKCRNPLKSVLVYSVTLYEIEDGVCTVKEVKSVGQSG